MSAFFTLGVFYDSLLKVCNVIYPSLHFLFSHDFPFQTNFTTLRFSMELVYLHLQICYLIMCTYIPLLIFQVIYVPPSNVFGNNHLVHVCLFYDHIAKKLLLNLMWLSIFYFHFLYFLAMMYFLLTIYFTYSYTQMFYYSAYY